MKVVGARRVWLLAEVTAAIAVRFEDLRAFWVEAEVEDIRRAGGQVYFRLRGEHVLDASMRAVVFDRIVPRPVNGTLVHAHGRIEFYPPKARVSMRVEVMEAAGEGLLKARIAELRARLAADGLLDPALRRPLPLLPRRVALVTSLEGAAKDDFLRAASARHPGLDIVVVGCRVQGDGAPATIVRALERAVAQPGVEVVVLARGGGSLDDLMAFNSEPVCRAVAACPLPIVSAVGHERDETLCDAVADLRAATPTAAAVAVVPSREALLARLDDLEHSLAGGVLRVEAEGRRQLALRSRRLGDGLARARERGAARLAGRGERLEAAAARVAAAGAAAVAGRGERLQRAAQAPLTEARGTLMRRPAELRRGFESQLQSARAGLERASALLAALSPQATVARGYAIVRHQERVVTAAGSLRSADLVRIELADGEVAARVEESHEHG